MIYYIGQRVIYLGKEIVQIWPDNHDHNFDRTQPNTNDHVWIKPVDSLPLYVGVNHITLLPRGQL